MATDKDDDSNIDKEQPVEEEVKLEEEKVDKDKQEEKRKEPEGPEKEEVGGMSGAILQVYSNDLILKKITSYLQAPEDRARLQRTCHRLKDFCDNFESYAKTLTIMRTPASKHNLLEVTYGRKTRYLKLERTSTMGSSIVDGTLLDKIIEIIPKGEIEQIKRVIVRGITTCFKDSLRMKHMISIHSDFGPFLDKFVGMKHLELSRIDCQNLLIDDFAKSEFINRINSVKLFDLEISIREFWKLVGKNIKKLELSERMVRFGEYGGLRKRGPSIEHVSLLLDDKNWQRHASDQSREYLSTHFYVVPWYLMYERKINFKGDEFVSIKHCKDLRYVHCVKLHREVDTKIIQKTIAQLRHLPLLEKLSIDGYYTLGELKAFARELKKCKRLESVELRLRRETKNEEDWVKLIKKLPKKLRCVKLDSFSKESDIIALKTRLSKSLVNLEFRLRDNNFSSETLRIIYQDFPKLAYLRIYGIRLTLDNIELLKTSNIQTVHFETAHHEKASKLETAMKQGYRAVNFRYGPGWSMEWNLYKKLRSDELGFGGFRDLDRPFVGMERLVFLRGQRPRFLDDENVLRRD